VSSVTAGGADPDYYSEYEDCLSRKSSETTSHWYRSHEAQQEEEEAVTSLQPEEGGLCRKTSDYFDPVD
jgi:hypothetical protein